VHTNIRTAELGLLFKAFKTFATDKTGMVPLTGESWNQLMQEIAEFAGLFRDSPAGSEGSEGAVRRNSQE